MIGSGEKGRKRMTSRAGIENTLNRYALALDARDFEGVAATFTADATLTMRVTGGGLIGPFQGRDAIRAMMREAVTAQTDLRRHICTNLVVHEAANGRARTESYLLLIAIENSALRVLSTAVYEDELVDEGDAWRLSKRHIALDLPY
jgi:3-phenylpropionate/cinnamic acid dioxygenase small subunit